MNPAVLAQKEIYGEVNGVTGAAHSVIFGTESMSELPVAELVQDFGLNLSVCNRSVEEATLTDAFDLLDECVYELEPSKLFLNFGETDMRRGDFDEGSFLADYARLIEEIRARRACEMYLVSVVSPEPGARSLNEHLQALAEREGCRYLDLTEAFRHEKPRLRIFSELARHMREGHGPLPGAAGF